nr:radical SAM protein [Enterocloster clostridioformis]
MGRKYNEDELLAERLKDRQYYGMSGGGVTFSGGEPLYYSEIIGAIGEQMHRRGYNTLVETCGHVPQKALEDINGRVDYIYHDFKQIDSEKHKELTGVDNTLILSNLEWLCGPTGNCQSDIPIFRAAMMMRRPSMFFLGTLRV